MPLPQSNVYLYPKLRSKVDLLAVRIGGVGLGNHLFPWARAVVASRSLGAPLIWPTWPQVIDKPFRAGDRDKRTYHNLFSPAEGYITGWQKLRLLAGASRVPEAGLPSLIAPWSDSDKARVVVFSGMEGFFEPFISDYEVVREELLRITRPQWKPPAARGLSQCVGIHVRLGDFLPADTGSLSKILLTVRIPITWYVAQVRKVRDLLGPAVPIRIFSDGSDSDLAPLLQLPDVERVFFGSSIADVLALSECGMLITSGSTFSLWSAFLGRKPAIWYPSQLPHPLYGEAPHREVQLSDSDRLPAEFAAELRSQFR